MSKHNDLSNIIVNLTSHNINIAAIAVQEVWEVKYPELVEIPGFKFISKTRLLYKGGGIAFYIKKRYSI